MSVLHEGIFASLSAGVWDQNRDPEIRRESLFVGAAKAVGNVVLFDVLRSYTTLAMLFAQGVEEAVLVARVKDAVSLRDRGLVDLAVGGFHGDRPVDYDLGNSPVEIDGVNFAGAKIAMRSSAGTQGVFKVRSADSIYLASFLNADATAKSLLSRTPPRGRITLVDLGFEGVHECIEDRLCRVYFELLLEAFLRGKLYITEFQEIKRVLELPGSINEFFTPEEIELALQLDRFDFAIRVERRAGIMVATAEYPTE